MFMQQPCAYPAGPCLTRMWVTEPVMSSAAQPDSDDWTQISNLAERRKIQNRISQRNYRKKHGNRLEGLERQFGSSDAQSDKPKNKATTGKRPLPKLKSQSHATKPVTSQVWFPPDVPPIEPSDDLFFPGIFYDRARSNRPPPIELSNNLFCPRTSCDRIRSNIPPQFTYSTYSAPEEILIAPYGATQPELATTSADAQQLRNSFQEYL
ncbi:hypothetical protein BGZ63DRAFT_404434 [Mariannaea sp. PMI_226]|nr:hypothetical protein BGZ63DRAFT_404434 [Mariannaea sp. PMI_226]